MTSTSTSPIARPASPELSILVLTRNEALHIERCLTGARRLSPRLFVVDSNSSDGTAQIAARAGAQVISGNFDRFADKLNWSLANVSFGTPWVLRLDADEMLTDELVDKLPGMLAAAPLGVNGMYLRRQLWFMGRWVRHGGMYPTYSMRLYRPGTVQCEARALDEHMVLSEGHAIQLKLDLVDNPLFNLSTWIDKHNRYATLEAQTALDERERLNSEAQARLFGTLPQRVRWLKTKVFYRLPLFVRPMLYFFYRYVLRLGFLDGRTGFLFHFLHGLWYRMLVDAKMLEARHNSRVSS